METEGAIATFSYLMSGPAALRLVLSVFATLGDYFFALSLVFALVRRNEVIIRKMRLPYR